MHCGPTVHSCNRTLYNPFQNVIIALFVLVLARDAVLLSSKPRPSFTFAPVARASPSPLIPVVPAAFLRFTRWQHCDQRWMRIARFASTRAHRPDFASASRLVVSASSPLAYSMPRRFRHSRYFAVCKALVNPSAALVWVGSFITTNYLSSCFAWNHRSLVSRPHPCLWMIPRAAVGSKRSRSLIGSP